MIEEEEKDISVSPKITGIYLGSRGDDFKTLIGNVLKVTNISPKYMEILLEPQNMILFGDAFTSQTIDENNNYQVFEQLGDVVGNKFIVEYFYLRFPQLACAEGVKIVARLKINYGSKQSFASFAENFGFWDYISATNEVREKNKESLLEDVFESFLGVTEYILNSQIKHGVGYAACCILLQSIFNKKEISLRYEDLYDAKTRLKELFDLFNEQIGTSVSEFSKVGNITTCTIFRRQGYQKIQLAKASATIKAEAEQLASAEAIKVLEKQGYIKYPPKIYAKLTDPNWKDKPTQLQDVLKICEKHENINEQFFTKGKSKHQPKYTSTVLGLYCRKRDYEGIKIVLQMGADINVPDIEGVSPADLLLIGRYDKTFVEKIFRVFYQIGMININKNVYDIYGKKYNLDMSKINIK